MKKAVSVILTLSLFLLAACSLELPNGRSRQIQATKRNSPSACPSQRLIIPFLSH